MQGIPVQELQPHEGGKKCRGAQPHVGVPVGLWVGPPPSLQLPPHRPKAAVLLSRIRQHLCKGP